MTSPRYLFGSGASDFAIAPPSRHGGFVVSAASLGNGTLWSASSGGTQYTDLQTSGGGATTTVSTDAEGSLVPFYGPPGVDGAWLDFGGGSRAFLPASSGQDAHVAELLADDTSAAAIALEARFGGSTTGLAAAVDKRARLIAPTGSAAANVTTLQEAVNEAASAGAPLVVRGSFDVSGSVAVPSNSDIDFTQARITQTATLTPILTINAATGVYLRNLRTQGKTTDYINNSTVYGAAAVRITGTSSDIHIEGGSLLGMAGLGVFIDGTCSDVHVHKVTMTGAGSTYILGSTYNYSAGVAVNPGATNWSVTACDISDFAQGVVTGDNLADVRIIDNYIHDIPGQHGLYIETVNGAIISGNLIRNTTLLGMKIQVGTVDAIDADTVTISDNIFLNVGAQGILLDNPVGGAPRFRRVSITGNLITGSSGPGIEARYSAGLHIADNFVSTITTGSGIRVWNSSQFDITANRVNTCAAIGIDLKDVQDFEVRGNRVVNPGTANGASTEFGLVVDGSTTADGLISDNRITDTLGNMRYGMYVIAGDQTTLSFVDNYSTGATDYGARLIAGVGARAWRDNSMSGSLGSVLNPVSSATVVPFGGPGTHNLAGANFDPALAVANGAVMTAGVLYLHKVPIPAGGAISTVWLTVGVAGSGLTAGQCFVGVYNSAGTTLLGQSADLSGTLNSTGNKAIALTAPTAAVSAGASVYVAILWNGTTSPQVRGISGSATAANINLSASTSRWATAGTAQTSLPATIPAMTAATVEQWVGVS